MKPSHHRTDLHLLQDTPPWDWPRNAGEMIQKALMGPPASATESNRLIAAELAGDLVVMNDNLAGALLGILRRSGETEPLRARAAISLGPVLEQTDLDGFDDPFDTTISERTFDDIKNELHKLYMDARTPKEVRRRILEASVRAPQDWHRKAIATAYSGGDREWMLTAVFAMRRVRGFDEQILEALQNTDPEIHREAILAAGNWKIDAAWAHIAGLLNNPATPKRLLLAAIDAAGTIPDHDTTRTVLAPFADSEDEDIKEAVGEALLMLDEDDEEFEDEEDEADRVN